MIFALEGPDVESATLVAHLIRTSCPAKAAIEASPQASATGSSHRHSGLLLRSGGAPPRRQARNRARRTRDQREPA